MKRHQDFTSTKLICRFLQQQQQQQQCVLSHFTTILARDRQDHFFFDLKSDPQSDILIDVTEFCYIIMYEMSQFWQKSFYYFFLFFLLGHISTLARSHSIASAGDKSLILSTVSNVSPPVPMHHQSMSRHAGDLANERLLHELQMTKK
jgi:hypothetical protein